MHDKDFDIYDAFEQFQRQTKKQQEDFLQHIERLDQEITLLRNDLNLVTNEGCWLLTQNSNHNCKGTNE